MSDISGSYTASLVGTIKSHLASLQGYNVMALELIQNADDAEADEIVFDITTDGLRVHNSGQFSYCGDLEAAECEFHTTQGISCDYHRIIVVANGEKLTQRKIGRFGIGFVSVYQITDRPSVSSSSVALTLMPELGRWSLAVSPPGAGTSIFLPWAREANTRARKDLSVSAVDDSHIERLTSDLQSVLSRSLLFLRHVKKAEIWRDGRLLLACDLERGEDEKLAVRFRPSGDEEQWRILRGDASVAAQALYSKHPSLKQERLSHDVSIGLRVVPEPLTDGLFYAFLPTEQSTGLPLHVNADFFPESDRKQIILDGHQHEQAWNEMLVDTAAAELAEDVGWMRETLGDAQFWKIVSAAYDMHFKPPAPPTVFDRFWDRLKPACANAEIVLAQDESLRRPNETILPYRALFTPRQVGVLRELGGHVALDSLQAHRNAMNQLGAQILTLDRMLNLIQAGLSVLKAGESECAPERVEDFYKPLWAMLSDLLPDAGSAQSPAMASAVQRLKTLPAIVSEDLFCVTIHQSYAAPSALDGARIAQLLPRLSIASKGLGATPKVLGLVSTLDLARVVKHLSGLAQDGSIADGGISVEAKDLKDLYNLFADLDAGKHSDESVYKELRALPVWQSTRGLISAQAALLPGNFTDPSGVGDLLDTSVLSDRARDFVSTKLRVVTQSIEAFVKTVVPSFFGDNGPADTLKYEALITELANHPGLLDDDDARKVLRLLPMVPTLDGGWSRPVETYRRTEALVRVLGEANHLWLDTGRTPRTRSVQSFLDSLGLRSTPMAEHLAERILTIAEDLPTDEAKRASAEAFYVLCDNFDIWKDAPFFLTALGDLRQASCFPAEGDAEEWHTPDALYAIYSAEAFRSQAKILDFRNTTRLKTQLLEVLGIKINPETLLVVRHLQHCMEEEIKPSDVVYRVLNDRASQDKAAVEVLADSRCIYVEALKSFLHPQQLFWSAQQLGRFAFTIPSNLNSYRPLFDALGVIDGPGASDYVRIIREISDEYFLQSKTLQGQDRAVFDLCWKALATLHEREDLDGDELRGLQEAPTIVNVTGYLADPDEVLIQDSEWYAGFFDGELDSALCRPLPELWPLFEDVGVRRLSQQARVALEFTDGDEVDEADLANTLAVRSDLIQRMLHDKSEIVRKAVAFALSDLTAASYEVVRIQASVHIGEDDAPPQPASPIRANAYYDRETHVLSLERPVGDRSWSHVLNALLHQLIPDAAGSEVPKLTLSLRPLMGMPVEDGHRELSDAGVPELEDIAVPEVTEDVTSPELGEIGAGAEAPDEAGEGAAEADAAPDEDNEPESDADDRTAHQPEAAREGQSDGTADKGEQGSQPAAQPASSTSDQARGGTAPTGPTTPVTKPATSGPVGPGTGSKKPRPKYKVQRDRRLLSYVNHASGNGAAGEDEGNSGHNMAIEAAARDAVCKYEIARGRTPKQMALTHPGYDILSQDMVRGTQRLIEVKGVAGEWNKTGVGLSKLQFANAQEYPEQYWLYVVELVSDPPNMRIHPIAKPATQVTSFMFDGNWRAVVDEEPVDPVVAFRAGVRVKHQDWGYGRIASVDVRGSMRVLAIDFEKDGRRTVTLSVHTLSVVSEEDDGDAPAAAL
jgi:hypothetical protein